MKIAFLPLNQNHIENYEKIIEYIKESLNEKVDFFVYDFDGVLHQSFVYKKNNDVNILKHNLTTDEPFYTMGFYKRIKTIWKLSKDLDYTDIKYDLLIHGSDCAMLHLIISRIPKPDNVVCILDGFLREDSVFSIVKLFCIEKVRLILRGIGLSYLVPSMTGSNISNKIFVISDSIKNVLRRRGYSGEVIISKMPRHKKHCLKEKEKEKEKENKKNLMYATTAFAWHGLHRYAQKEEEAIRGLINFKEKLNFNLRIRVHPRGDAKNLNEGVFKTYVKNNTLYEDLFWADVILSAGSSISYEALLYNKQAGILFPSSYNITDLTPIVKDLQLPLIESEQDLVHFIDSMQNKIIVYDDFDCEKLLEI